MRRFCMCFLSKAEIEIDRDETAEITFDNIPEWLLVEVLIRLPVNLVFRFKLVCKQWLCVVSDPSFARMYTSRASKSPQLQPWTFISDTMYVGGSQGGDFSNHQLLGNIYCRDIRPPSRYVLRCPSGQHSDRKIYKIAGVSNGLVLYGSCIEGGCDTRVANYSICNPITGQWITLPPLARPFEVFSTGFLTRVENGILTSYRVVHLNILKVLLRRTNIIPFEVFSSESGEWEAFNVYIDLEIEIRLAWPERPTSLNGVIHWITRKHGIIAYDPYKPDYVRILALPCDIHLSFDSITNVGTPSFCDAHQGQLRYFEMVDWFCPPHGFSSFSVWVLNDYSTGDWSLQHRINSSDILYHDILSGQRLSLFPISFHPFDSDIVYLKHKNVVVSYNIVTRELEAHGGPLEDYYKKWLYCFMDLLFVIPPWPICIPPPSFHVTDS